MPLKAIIALVVIIVLFAVISPSTWGKVIDKIFHRNTPPSP